MCRTTYYLVSSLFIIIIISKLTSFIFEIRGFGVNIGMTFFSDQYAFAQNFLVIIIYLFVCLLFLAAYYHVIFA